MLTMTMLVCVLNLDWETAGKTNGVHFFQQSDGDYDALRLVEYCMENIWRGARASTSSNKMMTMAMLLGLLNIAWEKAAGKS